MISIFSRGGVSTCRSGSGFHFHENAAIGLGRIVLFRENACIYESLERFLLGHSVEALFGALPDGGDVRGI